MKKQLSELESENRLLRIKLAELTEAYELAVKQCNILIKQYGQEIDTSNSLRKTTRALYKYIDQYAPIGGSELNALKLNKDYHNQFPN
jgi:DNA integrity scanning protein DisA with diadenylate cyclase activity